jgi:hypothetical protein
LPTPRNMRGACTGARSKPSSPADQLALTCSADRDAAANLARFGAHDPGQIDHNRKFSNSAGSAGVRKLLARTNFAPLEHKTFDALNFLCA